MEEFCRTVDISSWESAESFMGEGDQGLSQWHIQALTQGVDVSLGYDLFIDLSYQLAQIKSGFRKSYKSLINSGLRMWNVSVLAQANISVWEEFHALHVQVADKETRCAKSWDVQHQAIIEGDAFLVILRDHEGIMVGAGFLVLRGMKVVMALEFISDHCLISL